MLNESRYLQNFFNQQNAQMRKQIKEMNQFCQQFNCEKQRNYQKLNEIKQVNFLVIGPQKSGKLSLLQTMHFALNNHKNMQSQSIELSNAIIKRFHIKQSKKLKIQGLQSIKQTSQKLNISGFVVQQKLYCYERKQLQKMSKKQKLCMFNQKYSTILNLIGVEDTGCNITNSISLNKLCNNFNFDDQNNEQVLSELYKVKIILIVVNILQQISTEQVTCLKFFIGDLKEKGLKVLVILTHIDELNHLKENERLNIIEQKIKNLKRQLKISDREDFICIQSYKQFHRKSKRQSQKECLNNINFLSQKKLNRALSNRNRIFTQNQINSQNKYQNESKLCIQVPSITNRLNVPTSFIINKENQQNSQTSLVKILNKNLQKSTNKQNSFRKNINKVRSSKYLNYPFKTIQTINNTSETYTKSKQSIISESLIKNNQQTNFYSLKLLIKIIKQTQKSKKPIIKDKTFFKWFCG